MTGRNNFKIALLNYLRTNKVWLFDEYVLYFALPLYRYAGYKFVIVVVALPSISAPYVFLTVL